MWSYVKPSRVHPGGESFIIIFVTCLIDYCGIVATPITTWFVGNRVKGYGIVVTLTEFQSTHLNLSFLCQYGVSYVKCYVAYILRNYVWVTKGS